MGSGEDKRCCGSGRRCECSGILSGLLRPCLLLLIAESGSVHGYELAPALEAIGLDVKAEGGRLYRALRHLEQEGLVRSEWDIPSAGPPRRLYAVTGAGKQSLAGTVTALEAAVAGLAVLAGRIRKLLDAIAPPGDSEGEPG